MSMSVALSLIEQKKKRNKFLLIFFSIVLCCLIAVAGFFTYNFYKEKFTIEKNITKTLNIATNEINNEIDRDIDTLNILANVVADNLDLTTLENINTLLANVKNEHNYEKITYLDTNGIGYTYDYSATIMSSSDYTDNVCFEKALNNNICVNYDKIKNITSIAVPIYFVNEKKVAGIFLGEKTFEPFIIDEPTKTTKYKYDLFVINNNGKILGQKTQIYNSIKNSISEVPYQRLQEIEFYSKKNKINLEWINNNKTIIATEKLKYGENHIIILATNFDTNSNFSILKITNKLSNIKSFSSILKLTTYILIGIVSLLILIYLVLKCYKLLTKKADKSVIKWAMHDDVTDGFNRSKFFLEASKKLLTAKEGETYSLILMDIENFKAVNQMFDTTKGNKILKDISETIKWFLEKNGISARVMSDYFAILYKHTRDEQIINFINNITRAIGEYKLNLKLIPRFGIYKIDDYTIDVEEMLDKSLMAKKTLDEKSETNYAFFTKELTEKVQKAKDIENEMYFALNQNQFVIYLQPQVDTFTKDIVGAEALVRWNHPQNGIETPDKFLPIFEKNAFITYLDQYVIEKVCKIISKWIANGIEPIPISINISSLDLSNPRFADMMKSMVEMYKVPSKLINFEIDESVAFENYKYIASTLADLKSFGFGLNLDNFGKTYTSASIFNIITFDNVKFNRNFIKNSILTDKGRNILISLKSLVNSVYAKAIAIGIENNNELEFIKKAEFDYMQGYIHSRPMCVVDFEAFVFKRTIGNDEDICNG